MPGGHRQLSCDLLRGDADGFDLRRFDRVRAYGPGNVTRWDGRQAEFPSQTDEIKVSPLAEGYAAALEDDQTFRAIYVDLDLGHWQEAPLAERLRLVNANIVYGSDYSTSRRLGLVMTGVTGKSIPNNSQVGVFYVCPTGLKIAKLGYQVGQANTTSVDQSAPFLATDGPDFTTSDGYNPTMDDTIRLLTLNTARKIFQIQSRASAGHTPGGAVPYAKWVRSAAVFGNHGLTTYARANAHPGLLGSDIVPNILSRAAPQLKYTTGADGTIQPSPDVVIPHLVFLDPVSAGKAIEKLNAYYLRNWAVWDDLLFYWHEPESRGRKWIARIGQGARLKMQGETSEEVWTGVIVRYQTGSGDTLTIGPTAATVVDATSSYLEVTDPTNDALAHGVRRWAMLDLPVVTDQAGAIQIGNLWLAEANAKRSRGEIVLVDKVRDDHGVTADVAEVRAGDRVEVADSDDTTRTIISVEYDDDSQTVSCALDSTPHTLDALYERLGVSLVGVVE